MQLIKLTKIAANEGSLPNKHICVGDYRIGAMDHPPIINEHFIIPFVTDRNGEKNFIPGRYFMTSWVIEINELDVLNRVIIFTTENSKYEIKYLKDNFSISDLINGKIKT